MVRAQEVVTNPSGRTTAALDRLYDAWSEILSPDGGWSGVASAYSDLVTTMRDALSVEPLTASSLRVSGQEKRERDKERAARAAAASEAVLADFRRFDEVLKGER